MAVDKGGTVQGHWQIVRGIKDAVWEALCSPEIFFSSYTFNVFGMCFIMVIQIKCFRL